jgi:hypothetical protein
MRPGAIKDVVSLQASPFYLLDKEDRSRCIVESARDLDFEHVRCSADRGHTRPGKRLNQLNVVVPCKPKPDVMFTQFHDYLMLDRVREEFFANGVTGINFASTKAVVKGTHEKLTLWEAIVVGWGGNVAPESGVHLEEECPVCHDRYYSAISNPENLIQLDQWDGSDVFMIWPLPKFMFVTERVARLIIRSHIIGVNVLKALPPSLLGDDGFGPGGLGLWMPDERAHVIGDPLGIYSYRQDCT